MLQRWRYFHQYKAAVSSIRPSHYLHPTVFKELDTNLHISSRLLEFHSKTLIPLIGLAVEITGWFLWNLILSAIYQRTVGPIIVRDEFIHNFGPRLSWWTSLVLGLVTPIIMELAVQAVRRVYFPTDQDLMQRIEKDANSKQILKKYAMDGGGDVEAGNTQGIELEEMRLPSDQREEGVTLLADHGREAERSQSPQPVNAVPRRSFHELGQRRSLRVSHDDYRPPSFTPLVEEGENALEEVDTRRERG